MVVVRRGPKIPPLLRSRAAAAGVEPAVYVARAIEGRGTLVEAADDLGISLRTFRRWRTALGIEVQ